jgi:hypothetical protein
MSTDRFAELSVGLASASTRRQALKTLGAAAAGSVLALTGRAPAAEAAGRCKRPGQQCRSDSECCDGEFCDPAVARCKCFNGGNVCKATRRCIYCGENQVFNADTCQCDCAPGASRCINGICCPAGTACCGNNPYIGCCPTDTSECCTGERKGCCPAGECCPGGYCKFGYYGPYC